MNNKTLWAEMKQSVSQCFCMTGDFLKNIL